MSRTNESHHRDAVSVTPMRRRKQARNLTRRRLHFEPVEDRLVLANSASVIDVNPLGNGSNPSHVTSVGNVAYFVASDGATGSELWVTDGTQNGTRLVRDINPGADSSYPAELTEFDGQLFFVANDGTNGEELWLTDGTEAGTVLVRDIHAGTGYQYPYGNGPLQSFPRDLTNLNGTLIFSAEDALDGGELWISDQTTAGTTILRDIAPGTYTDDYGTYPYASNPRYLTEVNGELFFSADDFQNGRELWKTDGTASGTVLVKDIFEGTYDNSGTLYPNAARPSNLTAVDGTLFFVAQDAEHGAELWKSDGTQAGTVLVRDIQVGATNSLDNYSLMVALGDKLIFSANDGVHGRELWVSDGTAAGTTLLFDIQPGPEGDVPGVLADQSGTSNTLIDFIVLDDILLFTADDGTTGRELWRTDGTAAGTALVKDLHTGLDNNGDPYSSYPFYLHAVDGTVYFSASSEETGRELWQTDGTNAGTVVALDLVDGDSGSYPNEISDINGQVIFAAVEDGVRELYVFQEEAFSFELSVFVDGDEVSIPTDIGVQADGTTADLFSIDNGFIQVTENAGVVQLGDFFDVWQNDAGLAGNNPDAKFDSDELLGNIASETEYVHMFVNGAASGQYDEYVVEDGDEIVLTFGANPIVSLLTNFGSMLIELFPGVTPITVDNFLNYVNDGDYINSIFHRSIAGFVIQGGGFFTTSETFGSTAQLFDVPTDPPIVNEFNLSNTRATVSMAKLGTSPDSATSQFFVSLADNSNNLDNQNGGFTVFGEVLDMRTTDEIAALPTVDVGGAFTNLPVSSDNQLAVVRGTDGLGTLGGIKFSDTNENGVLDDGESVIAGLNVYIDTNNNRILDDGETFATTDSNGRFLLRVPTGSYTLRSEVLAGNATTSPNGGAHQVAAQIGRELNDLDFGEAILSPPTSIALSSDSDTGDDTDNVTFFSNTSPSTSLGFLVTGVREGATVRLFDGGVVIGANVADGDSIRVTTDGFTALAEGDHVFTATQSFPGTESDPSVGVTVKIDSSPPAALTSTPPDTAQVGKTFTYDAQSPDENTPGVTYVLVDEPAGMQIDASTGLIAWQPDAAQAVPTTFSVTLADTAGNMTTQEISLTVLGVIPAFPDSYPSIEDVTLEIGTANGLLANDGDSNSGTLTASVVDQAANGIVVIAGDGSFVYTPNVNFFGTDTFTYQASDGTDISNVATATITIAGTNDPPATMGDSYTATEETPLSVSAANGVLSNDTDPESDDLTVTIVDSPLNGSVMLNLDGSFVYTPAGSFTGSDSFSYLASDGTVDSAVTTVSLTVTEVNDAPVAVTDSYAVAEDGSLTVAAPTGVLANDTDDENDSLTAVVSSAPQNGTLILNANGSFTYTPAANFNGTDTFTYAAFDSVSQSVPAVVTISVTAVDDPPSAVDDSVAVVADGSTVEVNVLANDIDLDGQSLSITNVTQGSHGGTVTFTGTNLNYAALEGFVGDETFTYTITDDDGLTGTATVTATVTEAGGGILSGFVYLDANGDNVRDGSEFGMPGVLITLTGMSHGGDSVNLTAITSNTGFYSFDEMMSGTYDLTQTQPTATFDAQESTSVTGAVVGEDQITNIVLGAGQDLTENNFAEASIKAAYISLHWFFASSATQDQVFRNVVAIGEDAAGKPDLAQAIRDGSTEGPVNTPPAATGDSFSVTENTVLTVAAANGVLSNDTDLNGNTLTATVTQSPTNGSLTFDADGGFVYTPTTDFFGTDTFMYTASDGLASSNAATVTITVTEDAVMTGENVFTIPENSTGGTTIGTVMVDSASLVAPLSYEIDAGQNDALFLRPDDHTRGNREAPLVLIEYLDLQCPTCREFHPLVQGLADDFSASELLIVSRHLPLTTVHPNAFAAAMAAEAAGRQGMFDDMADLMFTNQPDWAGLDDPQPVFDSYATQLGLDLAQYFADVADPDIATRIERDLDSAGVVGATVTPTFFLNGRMIDLADALDDFAEIIDDEIDDFDAPFLINRSTGELLVTPGAGLNFESTPTRDLVVRATDINGQSVDVDVTVNLSNVNEASPDTTVDNYAVTAGGLLSVPATTGVLANDSDFDGDPLTAILLGTPANGTVDLQTDGRFTYTPNANFTGSDSFTYQASDGKFKSDATNVTIVVSPTNSPPVATNDTFQVPHNAQLSVLPENGVLQNDSDTDGDAITGQLVSSPVNGSIIFNVDGSFDYTPDADTSGDDFFTYQASDGSSLSNLATVILTVAPANQFEVFESAVSGTVVGTVTPSAPLGNSIVYEFDDPSRPDLLTLNANDHLSGDPTADVVLVEYVDFQCPVCASFHPIVEDLETEFAGDLLLVRRHLPLTNPHPHALEAARAAEAAGRQGQFEAMGNLLFSNQSAWAAVNDPELFFEAHAVTLGLNVGQYQNDYDDPTVIDRINRDFDAAIALGAAGTPTFFLDGQAITNPSSAADFENIIQDQIDAVDAVFAINRGTGEIVLRDAAALDFNNTPSYTLDVSVNGNDGQLETQTVTINVLAVPSPQAPSAATRVDQAMAKWTDPA